MKFLSNIEDYSQPLNRVSLDDAKKCALIDTNDLVYNFDGIAKYLCKELQRGETVASCDAMLRRGEQYYFLGFKNQPEKNIDPVQLAGKAFQSFQLFRLAIKQEMSVEKARDHLTLFIIYADEKSSFSDLRNKMHQLSKLPGKPILFDLRKVHGKLYQEIYTLPKSEFMDVWYPKLFPNT